MKNLTKIKIICAPQQAIRRLSREGVPVYGCKKQGAYFTFSVPDNLVKKVFAIFAHPCYNITIERESAFLRLKKFCMARPFIIAGGVIFAACAILSNAFVLRVEVTGSGAYLSEPVRGILAQYGIRENTLWRGTDRPAIISGILALPGVTFCSVQKRGSVVYVDVQAEEESAIEANYSPLVCDRGGVIREIVAVCGTANYSAGDAVSAGDTLISASCTYDGQNMPCMAAGYAVIECSSSVSYAAECESERNMRLAYAAALLYADGDEIISRAYSVSKNAEGVVYTVNITCLHTQSINFY